jgi:hypothetical protein
MRYTVEQSGKYWAVIDSLTEYVLGFFDRKEAATKWCEFLKNQ